MDELENDRKRRNGHQVGLPVAVGPLQFVDGHHPIGLPRAAPRRGQRQLDVELVRRPRVSWFLVSLSFLTAPSVSIVFSVGVEDVACLGQRCQVC